MSNSCDNVNKQKVKRINSTYNVQNQFSVKKYTSISKQESKL